MYLHQSTKNYATMVDSPPEANSTNAEDMENNPIDDTVDETAEESGDKSDEEEEDDDKVVTSGRTRVSITEKGVARKPYSESLRKMFDEN